jgi:hypothetical protein
MAGNLVQQRHPTNLTARDVEALIRAVDKYGGYWRPKVSYSPNPVNRMPGTRWLWVYWAGPQVHSFVPPVSIVRDSRAYSVIVLSPFGICHEGRFEEFLCSDRDWAIGSLQMVLDELWNVGFEVGEYSRNERYQHRRDPQLVRPSLSLSFLQGIAPFWN